MKSDTYALRKTGYDPEPFLSISTNLITTMLQPLRTILKVSCSGGFNHGQEQGSVSKKHEYSCLYSALWQ